MQEPISIVVAGDFCPTEHVEEAVATLTRPASILGPVVDRFRSADLAIANLEYPLTRSTTKLDKYGSHQKGDPAAIAVMKEAGVGLLTLANNHIMDYGAEGLADTLETCTRADIRTVGAGRTLSEASQPSKTTLKGRRVAVLGICENEFSIAREAHAGAAPLDPVANYHAIRMAREDADIVLVLFHGGSEFSHFPSPRIVRTCRFFVEAGATAVVCHHPHYVQGYELYRGAPILYSLGKLFYTRMTDPDILEVPIARLDFEASEPACSVHFDFFRLSLEQMRLVALEGEELSAAQARLQSYSDALASPERVRSEWEQYCMRRRTQYLFRLLTLPQYSLRVLRRLHLLRLVELWAKWKRRELLCLEDMIRCESHHEAVLTLLENERRR
jgi:hypothetical protein